MIRAAGGQFFGHDLSDEAIAGGLAEWEQQPAFRATNEQIGVCDDLRCRESSPAGNVKKAQCELGLLSIQQSSCPRY